MAALAARRLSRRLLVAVCCAIALFLLALSPVGQATGLLPTASAHALLVRSDPAANAILNAPPSQVRMWFSEDINPGTSRAVVVDTANREVDNKDARVSDDDSKEMIVTLPLLKAGTYVVVWRTQSSDDGHITGGSFIFRIAAPDGTVPPIPATLPTGNIPGGAGLADASSSGLDAPSIAQAVFTWLALLGMAFWVGGVIWETWILPSGLAREGALREAALASERRFRRLAPIALIVVLVADIGMILAQAAELAGDFSGIVSPPLLRAVLFGSRFGTFWWMRELVALAALIVTLVAVNRRLPLGREPSGATLPGTADDDAGTVAGWGHELLLTLRRIPQLPRRLVAGLRARTLLGGLLVLLAAALIVAFALSGHAAAVPNNELAYALAVDLFHLVCNAAWVGGLLYISLVFVPALAGLDVRTRARVLALGLPEFGAVAILSAFLLALTGSLNTTIHLTSIEQFLTTAYGRTLFVKIELFLLMVGISAWHAFRVRPQLAQMLAEQDARAGSAVAVPVAATHAYSAANGNGYAATGNAKGKGSTGGNGSNTPLRDMAVKLEDWLRREAMLGAAVLLCAALLGAFAGTLAAPPSGATPTTPSGPFLQTVQAGDYAITLNVVPAKFGTNTFTVTVKDSKGQPVPNAIVVVTTDMLDMDMGEQSSSLKPVGANQPGVYSGQGELTMGGHWKLIVKVVPPGAKQPLTTSFRLLIGY